MPLTPSMSVIIKTFLGLVVWAMAATAHAASTKARVTSLLGSMARRVIAFSFSGNGPTECRSGEFTSPYGGVKPPLHHASVLPTEWGQFLVGATGKPIFQTQH